MAKPNDEHKHNILHYALHNAITHKGKAEVKAVLGKILSEFPHLKKNWIQKFLSQKILKSSGLLELH